MGTYRSRPEASTTSSSKSSEDDDDVVNPLALSQQQQQQQQQQSPFAGQIRHSSPRGQVVLAVDTQQEDDVVEDV